MMSQLRRLARGVGMAALLIATIALVSVAVHRQRSATHPTPAPTGSGIPKPVDPSAPVKAATLHAISKTPTPYLSVANADFALAGTGGCDGTPIVDEVTRTGRKHTVRISPALHVVRLIASSTDQGFLLGADGKCRLTRYDTSDGGLTWTAAPSLGVVWAPLDHGVRAPTGDVSKPCGKADPTPVTLAAGGQKHAMVICRVGVFTTSDQGKHWAPVGALPSGKPAGLTLLPSGKGVIMLSDQGYCLGLRLESTTDYGHTWTRGPCMARVHAPAAISIGLSGDGLLLGGSLEYSTTDRGRTWTVIAVKQ